ncbi:MAG: LysM peptidoglycan-binding domain-containing protein [Phycisphaeraceae bacterium]|nr:LysM peptidoglycan-binding domain-containing protein [Phycisphaeraceae bacterium]
MTRETKIGLLAGMGIILLIGIIVSDLLVKPPQDVPTQLQRFAAGAQDSVNSRTAQSWRPMGSTSAGVGAAARPIPTPTELDNASVATAAQQYAADLINRQPIPALRQEQTPKTTTFASGHPEDAPVANGSNLLVPVESSPITASGTPVTLNSGSAAVTPTPTASALRTVTVEAGDTLTKIAERELGSQGRYREIFDANRDQLQSPDAVRQGMVLKIPAGTAAPTPAHATPAAAPQPARTYTVKTGDTLYAIAQKTLGSGAHWKDILAANGKTLRNDAKNLKDGQVLTIPSPSR